MRHNVRRLYRQVLALVGFQNFLRTSGSGVPIHSVVSLFRIWWCPLSMGGISLCKGAQTFWPECRIRDYFATGDPDAAGFT